MCTDGRGRCDVMFVKWCKFSAERGRKGSIQVTGTEEGAGVVNDLCEMWEDMFCKYRL